MKKNIIYDKKVININSQDSILEECKSTDEKYESNIYFNSNEEIIYLGSCKTDKTLGIFEWMEYNEQYLALFSKSINDDVVKISKLFNINAKEFIDGDEQSLYNTYFKGRKGKIRRKK